MSKLLTAQQVDEKLKYSCSIFDWADEMPFICASIRIDGSVCENIIESVDDLYCAVNICCGQCFNEYNKARNENEQDD